jgi:hypothetical protein
MSASDVFARIKSALDSAGIAYMLSGSFASAAYGVPRSTQDIDFVITATPSQLRTLIQILPGDRYYADLDAALEAHKRRSLFNVIDSATGWKIDFIICKSRAFSEEEFGRRRLLDVEGTSLFVASAEDVIIAKLEWSKLAKSQRQLEDVAAMLRVRFEQLDHSYLEKWIAELGLNGEWKDALFAAGFPNPSIPNPSIPNQ